VIGRLGRLGAAPRTTLISVLAAAAFLAAVPCAFAHTGLERSDALAEPDYSPSAMPSRIVINPTESPQSSQAFTWRTDAATTEGVVQIEPVSGGSLRTVEATAGEPVSFTGWTYQSVHHSAVVEGLTPDTLYRYRVGSDAGWSQWLEFKTADGGSEPWRMLYFGDAQNNIAEKWTPVVQRGFAETLGVALALHAGDLINTANLDHEWGEWFGAHADEAATVESLATPGNHEVSGDPTMIMFKEHFTNPRNGPTGQEEVAYYSDYQGVRIISLNSNTAADPLALILQRSFLDQALASNPGKWSIVTFHHPIYSASEGRTNPSIRAAFGPVLEQHNVDLVLQGHDHSYARGHVTSNETSEPGVTTGPVYVVSVSGPKYYELEPPESNDWTRNGATRVVAYQHTRSTATRSATAP
jgi:Purple acid Phosphatase, N-terminal domain/Calcineurin-like phosphoesterase